MEHEVGGKKASDVFSDATVLDLVKSACDGDAAGVKLAIDHGANPDARGAEGVTPVLWTLSCRNREGLDALLQNGADPDLGIDGTYLPVIVAATYDDPAMLEVLLDHGANPDVVDAKAAQTPLYKAFAIGLHRDDWRNYELLLARGADIEFRDRVGDTIAHYAIAMGRYDKLVALLERGYSLELEELSGRIERRGVSKSFELQYQMRERALCMLADKRRQQEC